MKRGFGVVEHQCNTTYLSLNYSSRKRDSDWWAVWLGRHPAETISAGRNGELISVGNGELSAEAKARLTVFRTA